MWQKRKSAMDYGDFDGQWTGSISNDGYAVKSFDVWCLFRTQCYDLILFSLMLKNEHKINGPLAIGRNNIE